MTRLIKRIEQALQRYHGLGQLAMIVGLMALPMSASQATELEHRVKAAYMYNFLRFIDWPTEAFAGTDGRYELCILGQDPFGDSLTPVARKRARNRGIRLRQLGRNADPSDCHVLFIGASEASRVPSLLGRLRNTPVLTVSELPGFAKRGGTVGFVLDNDKVRLEVNLAAARRAGLHISSKLLEVASEVYRR
jgi:hypothetical protein